MKLSIEVNITKNFEKAFEKHTNYKLIDYIKSKAIQQIGENIIQNDLIHVENVIPDEINQLTEKCEEKYIFETNLFTNDEIKEIIKLMHNLQLNYDDSVENANVMTKIKTILYKTEK